MSETSDSSTFNLDARIAVLEERTKPKARTVYDKVKDWSGILTFVIAVLYTYPLGVWDRFVVTAEQQRAKEIGDLRSLVLKVTEADSEYVRAMAGVTDPQSQSLITQTANARKAALLTPSLSLVENHYTELTGAEMELLGYQMNQLGDQGPLVSKMLENAANKMTAAKNTIGAADVIRIQAQMYNAFGSLGPDIQKYRELAHKSVNLLLLGEPGKSLPGAAAVAMDWANAEGTLGIWSCAEHLANWVISQAQYTAPAYAQQLQSQLAQMAAYRKNVSGPRLPVNQQTDECPRNVVSWTLAGWPWIVKK
jgi:hypothetical protein